MFESALQIVQSGNAGYCRKWCHKAAAQGIPGGSMTPEIALPLWERDSSEKLFPMAAGGCETALWVL